MQHDPKFWDKIAAKYFSQPIKDEKAYQRKLAITREHLKPDARVLEFGCGTGGTAITHAPHVEHVHAIDISENMLAFGRKQAKQHGVENVTFECADIAEFDAPEESYDAVLGMSILHLVHDREAVLARVHRLLKPGGVLITSTVCLGERHWYLKPVLSVGRMLGRLPFVSFLTAKQLENEMVAAGFRTADHWKPGKSPVVFLVSERANPPWEVT
ncbi:class I SAM-dependent methyltransferase [Parvularcula lutaonensis]|uniref:Class I SAM-dependent methyltransferase n=1 Tax=Parvularcula lutaonensis TaxID=491923 RepID=A0ABV7MB03_9PROT|nr:class I SAM-dependent methyltransferase [Parvularcula lutaonensis]GGY43278.1 hypothetical protein GCM10007148_09990 [Parvularcula lutaonensis]